MVGGVQETIPLVPNIIPDDCVIPDGVRGDSIFRHCMERAPRCSSLEQLLDIARVYNERCAPPLPDERVVSAARSAWKYTAEGNNFFARPQVMIPYDLIDTVSGDALQLLLKLKRYHGNRETFALAKRMAASMGWSLTRWRAARADLTRDRVIVQLHPGGRGPNDPPLFGWGKLEG
jgi:hypothetical protein